MDLSLFEFGIFVPYIYLYTLAIIALVACFFVGVFFYEDSELLIGENSVSSFQITDIISYIVVSLVVFLFIATRDESVGSDTIAYVDFFHDIDFYYMGDKTDFLFELHGRFLRLFQLSDHVFVFIMSLIYCSGLFFLIWKTSKYRMLSLFLFMIIGSQTIFLFDYLCLMRQCVALSYFFFSIYFLFESDRPQNEKLFFSGFFYLLAVLTHGSCLFTFPFVVLLFYNWRLDKKYWIILLVITYLLAAFDISFVSQILNFVMGIVKSEHYGEYADVSFGMIDSKGFFNMNLIPFILLASAILIMVDSDEIKDYKYQFALLSVVLNNVFYDNLMWGRLIMYFSMFMIVALPNALYGKSKYLQIPVLCFLFVYYPYKTFSQLLYQILNFDDGNVVIPYESWLIDFGYN